MPVIRRIEAEHSIDIGGIPNTRVDDGVAQGLGQVAGALSNVARVNNEMEMRRLRMQQEMDEFRTTQAFQRWNDDNELEVEQSRLKMDASGQGFTDTVSSVLTKRSEEFLQSVPEALRPKFSELVTTAREQWLNKAAGTEVNQRNDWYRTGIAERQRTLQTQVFNDPAIFDAARSDAFRTIDASGLSPAEKDALKRKTEEAFSLAVGEAEIRAAERNPATMQGARERLGVASGDAVSLLRKFEGFRPSPYWDVNALRTGYGSDTVTRSDGTVERVTKDTRVTRADAERDLARRAADFERTARGQSGDEAWASLPANARAALVSVAYNYGKLPASVVSAVKSGNVEAVASAVEGLGGHNNGVNRKRRGEEAAIIRGGAIQTSGEDKRYASLSLDQRMSIYDQMNAAAKRGQTAIDAQNKASYDAQKGTLELGIQTGEITSPVQIMQSGMTDAHKADLLSALRARRGDEMAVAEAVAQFQAGTLTVDPLSTEGKKTVDGVYGVLSKAVPQEQLQYATENLVAATGVMPQAAQNALRAGLESNSPADVAQAARNAIRINAINPSILGRRDGGAKIADQAVSFRHLTEAVGLSDQQAAQRIIDARDPEKMRARASLMDSKPIKDYVKDTATEATVRDIFDPGFFGFDPALGSTPSEAAAMVGEYRTILEESIFDAGGDTDLGKTLAGERFARSYGPSSLTLAGDGVVTRLPPEKVYPAGPDGTHGYIRDQMLEALKVEGIEAEEAFLQVYDDTQADMRAGRPPRYQLWYRENGQLQMYNLPFYAEPPRGAGDVNLDASRARRDQNRQDLMQGRDREYTLDGFLNGPLEQPTQLPRIEVPASDPTQPNPNNQSLQDMQSDVGARIESVQSGTQQIGGGNAP